jgi:acyl carrier protein
MSDEERFFAESLEFLEGIGVDTSGVRPQTHLVDEGLLDSLGILAFLDYLERLRGTEVEVENLSVDAIATLPDAYRFVHGEPAADR